MGEDRDQWIAHRAYELWEQAGRPDGQEHEHWKQASAEWDVNRTRPLKQFPSWDDEES